MIFAIVTLSSCSLLVLRFFVFLGLQVAPIFITKDSRSVGK